MYINLVNPVCTVCRDRIGEMTDQDYKYAVQYRGPILCGNCRELKCDCCGNFNLNGTTPLWSKKGAFLGNVCDTCDEFVLTDEMRRERLPLFSILNLPNLKNAVKPAVLHVNGVKNGKR